MNNYVEPHKLVQQSLQLFFSAVSPNTHINCKGFLLKLLIKIEFRVKFVFFHSQTTLKMAMLSIVGQKAWQIQYIDYLSAEDAESQNRRNLISQSLAILIV